ncbi:hypothetical protein Leryth_006773 [Lithospermum erythrorhizon]|uniref:Cytochrome P450 n=1 Tax=Lithospermum erythrorhizon TaxID=34254 RepID=A0AAV3NZC7_LITER|nr:hypothetical protein Leryth_006773 [Lithospermum erythrorhizon]
MPHYCERYFGDIQEDGGPGVAEKEYVDALFTLLEYMNAFCISDYLPWLTFLDVDGHEQIVRDATRVMEKYQNPIIEDRLNQFKDGIRKQPQDLLDVMITLKDERGNHCENIERPHGTCMSARSTKAPPCDAIQPPSRLYKGCRRCWLLHSQRHPDVWDNPSKFDPSRHIKNSDTKVEITEPNLNFIAFSTGTRQ